jgi:uncharacterized protein
MMDRLYSHCRESTGGRGPPDGVPRQESFGTDAEGARAMGLSRTPTFHRPMKRDLMEILCCPVCKGDLELRVDIEKDEILEGSLFCKHCNHRYEIKDGIPDLLPPDFK